jgi:hypothetical protein
VRSLIVDVGLPWLTVQLLERAWAVPVVPALAAAAIFPASSVLVAWAGRRRADWIGLAVLTTIAAGVATALSTGDARLAVLRGAPAFGLFGLACLASLRWGTPLMFFVSRWFTAAGDEAKAAAWTARLAEPGFRRAMRRLTLIWGLASLGECALGIAAAFALAPVTAMVVEPVLGIGTVAGLLAWTLGFARRRSGGAIEGGTPGPAQA